MHMIQLAILFSVPARLNLTIIQMQDIYSLLICTKASRHHLLTHGF